MISVTDDAGGTDAPGESAIDIGATTAQSSVAPADEGRALVNAEQGGLSVLMLAIRLNHANMVQLLLQHGAQYRTAKAII